MTDALHATIARTEEAIRLVPAAEAVPWRFARCWMLATAVEEHGGGAAELEAAIAEFHLLPVDTPGRAKLAAVLVVAQVKRQLLGEDARQAVALADIADADPAPLPHWEKASAAVRAMHAVRRLLPNARQAAAQDVLAEVERYAAVVGAEEPYATMVELARTAALHQHAMAEGDFASMGQVVATVDRLRRKHGDDSRLGPYVTAFAELMRAAQALQRGDVPAAEAALRRVESMGPLPASAANAVAALRAGINLLHDGIASAAEVGGDASAFGLTAARTGPSVTAADLEFYRWRASEPSADPSERSSNAAMLGLVGLVGDAAAVERSVAELRSVVAQLPVGDPHQQQYVMLLGAAHLLRYEQDRRPDDLADAISNLARARTLAGSPAHPEWATCLIPLGHAYRLAGHADEGRAIALEGLRGHAWRVLLQAGTGERTNATRDAAGDAIDVARWCFIDGDAVGAATALDAGRSLMLFAATEHRSVAERLVELGEIGLAERWRSAVATGGVDELPLGLRKAAFRVLATDGRLDPPALPTVQRALRTLNLDALVYLVPGDNGTGAAVIVPADGAPQQVLLPEVRNGWMPDLTAFAPGAGGGRDAAVRPARVATDDVYAWAWHAAVEPVLKRIPGPGGRPPRIALVPMRELATVPWHAARTVENGRTVYAIERAVFSYAVSARLLCDSAAATPVPLNDAGLFVGDPDTRGREPDLPAARTEAWAIRERYYPRATYVGRTVDGAESPSGPGRPDDIVAWLADPDGGSVLHLACHGAVRPVAAFDNPATETAYLVLDGGATLAAERILEVAGAADRPVGLVVLAACHTGVAGRGSRDEAFSLAATFLAGGARTVLSSLWSVPDGATSVLMYLFHHLLRTGLAPVDALRQAQLWMLDAHREPPADLPEALRTALARTDPASVDAWAGFVHIGR